MRRCLSILTSLAAIACSEPSDVIAPDAGPAIDAPLEPLDARTTDDAARADGGPIPTDVPAYIVDATPGEWTAIGVNTLADVAFDYGSVATPDGFRTGLQGLMDAWSGGTYARERHRLYVNGGGHRDYDGNEWYAFDVHAARWERVNDPSVYLETEATAGVFPDGAPIPIHTYDCLVYAPTTNSVYRMGAGGSPLRQAWEFSLDTLRWRAVPVEVLDPFGGTARWDPASESILLLQNAQHAAGFAHVDRFDPREPEATRLQQFGPTMSAVTGALDTTHGELVYTGNRVAPIRVVVATGVATPITTAGDTALEAMQGPGFTYDARRDRFTGWGVGDTRTLYHLSRSDWTWTTEVPSSGATPGAPNTNGVFGRFQYVPEYDVMILATTVSGPVMMWKPRDWSPPG
ncbi:hypothetical protein [Sandaracinus amylolyticus]|uniref:Uncharacterized protein n=1 Tax=Sandaracinus amylolyticus TaxID=927083 RepID=A0A0F6YFJ5_9BACT|nr:hypothetical protein [Sandaracinus amylolyticus]AKF03757.1 Hypothetical protein DB32_000906 [Sandaracinus amylolyticus]